MATDASAYAALGLQPGADDAAVEQAYKRLIKQHHPDRGGGNAERAAEITRAYRELREARARRDALELHAHPEERRRRGWVAWGLALSGVAAALLLATGSGAPWAQGLWPASVPPLIRGKHSHVAAPADSMDQPLHLAAIDGAARAALHITRSGDEMALAAASEACHHRLRTDPSTLELDRCAGFDDAVIQLEDRDPLRDQGPFGQLQVTGRQWSAASQLSSDYVAIDGRLDRIRLRVELALAPSLDLPQPVQPAVAQTTTLPLRRGLRRTAGHGQSLGRPSERLLVGGDHLRR